MCPGDPDWGEYWDLCLDQTLAAGDWSRGNYHSEDFNCFTFVLTFLRMLNQRPFTGKILIELHFTKHKLMITDWASSKVHFCQKLILPKTVLAGKYIMLYRKLAQNNGLIVV